MHYTIRHLIKNDWEQVKIIYGAGIATQNATFETIVPTFEKWIANTYSECCLVATKGPIIIGWCKLSPVSNRHVYAGVGEVSIYIHPKETGKGVGNILLKELIKSSEQQGFWTLQAGIFPENIPSLRLFEKNGFKKIGIRERIGKLNGLWRDVLLLERRSEIVGID